MAPGQMLIEIVIPIVSVAATIVGAFIVKKRRDRRKAEACKTIDVAENHRQRLESLEYLRSDVCGTVASRKYVEAQIQSAVDNLRAEIECVNERTPSIGEMESVKNDVAFFRQNTLSKGQIELYVNESCVNVLDETIQRVRGDIKKIDKDVESDVDAKSDVEIDMTDVRKVINEKLQEYDLAITKWIGKKLEGKANTWLAQQKMTAADPLTVAADLRTVTASPDVDTAPLVDNTGPEPHSVRVDWDRDDSDIEI